MRIRGVWTGVTIIAALAGAADARAGTVWFVRASAAPGGNGHSFASAFSSLDAAFAASSSGDEIRVAAGRYVPDVPGGRASAFALKPGVSLYGGFAGDNDALASRDPSTYPTVLSGDRLGDDEPTWVNRSDNCYRVLLASNPAIGPSTVLDGFVVTGGNADGAALSGGGLLISDCEPTVRACTFIENSAGSSSLVGAGGGVSIECPGAARKPRFDSCRFESNLANDGGAVRVTGDSTNVFFVRCSFVSNVAGAGGAMRVESAATVVNCTFLSNGAVTGDGGAIRSVGDFGLPWIVNCVFSNNTAAGDGGALSIDCCNLAAFFNCTIVGNYAGARAGGVRAHTGAGAVLTNSILFENGDSFGTGESAQASFAVGYLVRNFNSCLVTGWTGAFCCGGNISGDPMFADTGGPDGLPGTDDDNYRLLIGSPCIETGDTSLLPADEADVDADGNTTEPLPSDLENSPRTLDGDFNGIERVDIGAYEYHCPADFDRDAFVNGDDFDEFAIAFEAGDASADFDHNGYVNGDDFDGFVIVFEAGC